MKTYHHYRADIITWTIIIVFFLIVTVISINFNHIHQSLFSKQVKEPVQITRSR
jgi:hypothetical protein